ncbi:uncharacterized protein VTP21DRAFT_7540 [Calcarisporiella thermophila]|uniref:uncharacterized protein n=1 Tax=Calcarisporiella thermophila TaxID=911321 RepID=UPI00374462A3
MEIIYQKPPKLTEEQLLKYFKRVRPSLVEGKLISRATSTSCNDISNSSNMENVPIILPGPNLETSKILLRAHQTHVPFDNVGVHYFDPARPNNQAASGDIPAEFAGSISFLISHPSPLVELRFSLDTADLFYKIMEREFGGNCYENNMLLCTSCPEL